MADFGGEMRLTIGAQTMVLRGTFSLDVAPYTVATVTNLNRSISRQFKPDGYGADLKSLEWSPSVDYSGLMTAAPTAMNIIEDLTGRTHMFTNAVFEGAPMIEVETGEVTGLKIRAQAYSLKQF